ncbi:transposase [Paenibacillus solisilvae]|uniref:Transposase n=1 Tax=Paenibacillus solisilvae TaxID=2486751 RepID=A0ABW0W1P1_9BACL
MLLLYAGLVPKEYSSGSNRWQGSITKTLNNYINTQIRKTLNCVIKHRNNRL